MTKHAQIMKLLMELIMEASEECGVCEKDAMDILKELRQTITEIETQEKLREIANELAN